MLEELGNIKSLKLSSRLPKIDQELFVVGNPGGLAMNGFYNHDDNWLDYSGASIKVTNPTETIYFR